jgi:hypothetical protein
MPVTCILTVAQMVERKTDNLDVAGSIPVSDCRLEIVVVRIHRCPILRATKPDGLAYYRPLTSSKITV